MRYARCRCSRAHPRSRGENGKWSGDTKAWLGSSPLTRGKRSRCRSQEIVPGLIPAYAGKTLHDPAHRSASTAHPRSHGENAMAQGQISAEEGSSPLTRGKQLVHCLSGHLLGLIPTHSGKTPFPSPRLHACQAHPAHARKTWRCSSTVASRAAHPCSRGENSSYGATSVVTMGSPPFTRGKPAWRRVRRVDDRLIPTHAGKTSAPRYLHP